MNTTLIRTLILFVIWWALTEGTPSGAGFGLVVAFLAALLSVRLFPPFHYRLRPAGTARFAAYFIGRSVVAGLDVARRILSPVLPVRPGYLQFSTRLPEGPPRWLLANTLSLMPGTLTVTLQGERLELHCLDVGMPIDESVRRTEMRIAQVFGIGYTAGGGQGQ